MRFFYTKSLPACSFRKKVRKKRSPPIRFYNACLLTAHRHQESYFRKQITCQISCKKHRFGKLSVLVSVFVFAFDQNRIRSSMYFRAPESGTRSCCMMPRSRMVTDWVSPVSKPTQMLSRQFSVITVSPNSRQILSALLPDLHRIVAEGSKAPEEILLTVFGTNTTTFFTPENAWSSMVFR